MSNRALNIQVEFTADMPRKTYRAFDSSPLWGTPVKVDPLRAPALAERLLTLADLASCYAEELIGPDDEECTVMGYRLGAGFALALAEAVSCRIPVTKVVLLDPAELSREQCQIVLNRLAGGRDTDPDAPDIRDIPADQAFSLGTAHLKTRLDETLANLPDAARAELLRMNTSWFGFVLASATAELPRLDVDLRSVFSRDVQGSGFIPLSDGVDRLDVPASEFFSALCGSDLVAALR